MFSTYSFIVTDRERDWLLIALGDENFKHTQSANVYIDLYIYGIMLGNIYVEFVNETIKSKSKKMR